MITLDTIAAAIAIDDMPAIRAAFDALVAYPDQPLDGFTDQISIFEALDQCCGVLIGDLEFLPENSFALLWRLGLEAGVPTLQGQSYGAGANLVLRTSQFFAERFAGKHQFASA